MKPFAMPSVAAARPTALDLLPAERTIDARLGKARSGGCGPRPPVIAARATVPTASTQHLDWKRRARTRRVGHNSTSSGNAARA